MTNYDDAYQLAIVHRVIEDVVEKYVSGDQPEIAEIICEDVPYKARVVPQESIHGFLGTLRDFASRLQARLDRAGSRSDAAALELSNEQAQAQEQSKTRRFR